MIQFKVLGRSDKVVIQRAPHLSIAFSCKAKH
jgi:hypothetical protein